MASKPWVAKPRMFIYVVVTIILSVLLSLTVLWVSRLEIAAPKTAVSTQKISLETLKNEPTVEFKTAVESQIDAVSTISARLKNLNNWIGLDLPKINLEIDF